MKMDGSGYPLHLEKEHLTLADRIISIADIFTALTEDRPYRKGMAWQEALQIMEADVINGALIAMSSRFAPPCGNATRHHSSDPCPSA